MAATTRLWFLRGFTTKMVNPVTRLFFGRLPRCGILTHTGRTSGHRYRAPIFVLRRGDEHTSELQSPCNLVCRLLLEKKKNNTNITFYIKKNNNKIINTTKKHN